MVGLLVLRRLYVLLHTILRVRSRPSQHSREDRGPVDVFPSFDHGNLADAPCLNVHLDKALNSTASSMLRLICGHDSSVFAIG